VKNITVPFNNQEILAIEDQNNKIWIALKPICENLSID
jgi:hypothetical protein